MAIDVPKPRFHQGDGWGRGSYRIPATAVAGSSITANWEDSPAKPGEVKQELNTLRAHLKQHGVKSRIRGGSMGGTGFAGKAWVVVAPADYAKARELSLAWLKAHDAETMHIHDAEG